MPNWCAGSLKVRGDVKNIIRFLEEGLKPIDYVKEDAGKKIKVEFHDKYGGYYDCYTNSMCHIKHTRRGFVQGVEVEFDAEGEVIIVLDAEFAWYISSDGLVEVCREFGVDMRIYAFEQGMGFNQEVEIIDGELMMDRQINFDDYTWECPMPQIGG